MTEAASSALIPYPPKKPVVGNMLTVSSETPLQSLMELTREHGPIFGLDMMGTPLIVVSGAALIDELCDEKRFDKAVRGSLRRIRAIAGDGLKIDVVVAGIDGSHNRLLLLLCDQRRDIGRQCGEPDHGLVRGKADTARRGYADTQARKAAGAGGDGDAVEIEIASARGFHDARDQRHQRLGVAPLHLQRFLRDHGSCAGVENGGSAVIQRGIDGENDHGSDLAPMAALAEWQMIQIHSHSTLNRNGRDKPGHFVDKNSAAAYIGRTSTTSGMKCFSRFWMPCLSVAVDDGHPAQEPFMSR